MRVLQVVPSISLEASGPSYSVPGLCNAIVDTGAEVTLHVLGGEGRKPGWRFEVVEHEQSTVLPRLGYSPGMRRALGAAAKHSDILHNHSLWMMPNVYPAKAVRGTRCRLVVSPRGVLSPWALGRSRWQKKLFWWLAGQRATMTQAACFHATAESEYREIRAAGLRAPVAIIPNGIDLPLLVPPAVTPSLRRLLFVSRMNPGKGIDHLLRAWASLERAHPEWELHVVGTDEDGYGTKMRALAQSLGLGRVHFPGPLYGVEKDEAYRQAALFVLPSLSENFGMVVAEALSHAVPAVVSQGAPWGGLERQRAGWWPAPGEVPLRGALEAALATSPAILREMGLNGRAWMEREFSWKSVGEQMRLTYEWLLGGGAPPEWVRIR